MALRTSQAAVIASLLLTAHLSTAQIDRAALVRRFNPGRSASSHTTPLQVGNGDFAFGADITGLQTFLPFNSLSSWCWHNSSLPTTSNQTEPEDFSGLDWLTNSERLVNYAQPNDSEADISQWMIANPHRVNLGAVGLWFGGEEVFEADLENKHQVLDQYAGTIDSWSNWKNESIRVETVADPGSSTVAIRTESMHLMHSGLGVFFDFP